MADVRPCERQCQRCELWKHHSRFTSRKRVPKSGGLGTIEFDTVCKDCQKIERHAKKNDDRALAIVKGRSDRAALAAGVPKSFMWVNMNHRALVGPYRAAMADDATCKSCGHPFDDEKDIQFEHREPPRHAQDWARLHARNIDMACGSCNGTKNKKGYAEYLDGAESERLTNERDRAARPLDEPGQLSLWDVA